MILCYLGLGSNLRTPERQLRQAINRLRKLPSSTIVKISSFYYSYPLGVHAQPNYCNLVLSLYTSLSAQRLLYHCQQIEHKQHRVRKRHWGPRTLDIDLLLYGDCIINTHDLVVPHSQMLLRDFVLKPLLEISPLAKLPNQQLISTYQYHKSYVIS